MHIVLAILGILSAIAVWYWRLQVLGRAARDARDAAKTAANLPRKLAFQHKARKTIVDITDDPREAACAIMSVIANADGEPTEAQLAAMMDGVTGLFRASTATAEELVSRGDWISRQVRDPRQLVRRMTKVIASFVTPRELSDLAEVLENIALANGDVDSGQASLIGEYLRTAGLRTG